VPALTAVVGEVSLAGEVRPVPHLDRRARAVAEMSFARLVHPAGAELQGAPASPGFAPEGPGRAGLCPAATLAEAVRVCFAAPA
jgi:DNA repair protein RadA/Sms